MSDTPNDSPQQDDKAARQARLNEALRANLKKRKSQAQKRAQAQESRGDPAHKKATNGD